MKKRSLIYTIIVIALFEKVIFWLGVLTAQDPPAQLGGIWKITFVFTMAAGYLAYWAFSQKEAPANETGRPEARQADRPAGRQVEPLAGRQAQPLPRPGLTPVIIHPIHRSSGD